MININMIPLLFTNMFFVIFSLLIYQLFVMEKNISSNNKKVIVFLLSASALVLCVSFPITVYTEILFDLRQIPLILGFLYGGPPVGVGLYLLLIGYRFLIGGAGAYFALIENTGLLIILFLIYQKYKYATGKKKFSYIIYLSAFIYEIAIVLYLFVPGKASIGLFALLQLILTVVIIAVLHLSVYFIEAMFKNQKMREKLVQTKKTEIVSHLAASISHEIRNPLTVSRGFLQLLNDSTITPRNRSDYVQLAIKEIDRAVQIITDYLAYAKPSIEKRESLDMAHELSSIVDVMTPFANMRSVQFVNQLTPNYLVIGDKQKFKQSMLNILKNSIEAMPVGGMIHVTTYVELKHYYITIEDHGTGMTSEQMDRLGEPYFSTKDKGTGLGMMVVYSNIKAMNGKIHVTSIVGKGTKFTIQFPLESKLGDLFGKNQASAG